MKIRKDFTSNLFSVVLNRNLTRAAPLKEQKAFLNSLIPVNNGVELILIGGDGDGSYLIPNDLKNIEKCISPGYGGIAKFESELYSKFKISSVIIDPDINSEINNSGVKFIEKFIGARNTQSRITINEIVKDYTQDLLLQMDIEGNEYEALLGLDLDNLNKFRIIVVELHNLHFISNIWLLNNVLKPAFLDILQLFDVVVVRSSSTQTFLISGMRIPDTVEITFHRKDRGLQMENTSFAWSELVSKF
jgi:hypothetical protein